MTKAHGVLQSRWAAGFRSRGLHFRRVTKPSGKSPIRPSQWLGSGMLDRPIRHYRTLFLSDFHLGTRGCRADRLLDFLRWHDADTIYLVGDIVDGWRLRKAWYWPQSHSDVVQKLLRKARKGTRIVYVPGNHDEFLRDFTGLRFGGIELVDRAVHRTADGTQLLVLHGDEFDAVVRNAPWLSHLGDGVYRGAIMLNIGFNNLRRKLGLTYWSLSDWAKQNVKNAVKIISDFETALVHEARLEKVDGVICGHIHKAADHTDYGIRYLNTGDWVESCTALAEHHDGTFEILHWAAQPTIDAEPDTEIAEPETVAA
jgi:UDP-2,3-diacylglucosamine pyrophosphatase LpxH